MKTDCGYFLNDPSSIRYTAAIKTRFINLAYIEYYNILVKAGYQGLLATPTDLNIVANTETVALPTDFFYLLKLSRNLNSKRITMKPYIKLEGVTWTAGVAAGDAYIPKYSIRGTNIVLDPLPSTSVTAAIHCEYFPVATEMTTDGTSPAIGFSAQFHPMIPLKAAILLKGTKEDEDVDKLERRLSVMEQPFWSLISSMTKQRKKVTRFMP